MIPVCVPACALPVCVRRTGRPASRLLAPNIQVWQDPKLTHEGHDPQLGKTVQVLMRELKTHPAPVFPRPPYPNHHPHLPPIH